MARAKKAAKKPAKKKAASKAPARVVVENVNVPGYTTTVDAAKYRATRKALLKALPARGGLTQAEMMAAVKSLLPESLFPGGEKSEWWTKCVQLDLEAKGLVVRDGSKPLRWRKR